MIKSYIQVFLNDCCENEIMQAYNLPKNTNHILLKLKPKRSLSILTVIKLFKITFNSKLLHAKH